MKASEKYGREAVGAIAQEVEGKTLEQVKVYHKVFWQKHQELQDWDKVISAVEKGESRLRRNQEIQQKLEEKVAQYRHPMHQLRLSYGANKVRQWTEEEDRFLVVALTRIGYASEDVYDRIRHEVRQSDEFRFDWFFKSRSSQEIARRCHTLVLLVEKELD